MPGAATPRRPACRIRRRRRPTSSRPTNAPLGHIPPAILAEAPVDVALLCVGSYGVVANQPRDTLANLQPRFALSGHWEDFFQPVSAPLQPIPFLDVNTYVQRAEAALPGRHELVHPGDHFEISSP